MKRILVIEGSPRKGNTAAVTDWVLAGLGGDMAVERIRAAELDIHPCRECLRCTKTSSGARCGQDDDMVKVYDKLVDSDLTIFTTPVFCWGPTAQLKNVLDRCFALFSGENILKGAKWALVITAGGDHYDGAELVVTMFKHLCRFVGIEYLGQHVVAPCPDRRRLKQSRLLARQAKEFGRGLREALVSR